MVKNGIVDIKLQISSISIPTPYFHFYVKQKTIRDFKLNVRASVLNTKKTDLTL